MHGTQPYFLTLTKQSYNRGMSNNPVRDQFRDDPGVLPILEAMRRVASGCPDSITIPVDSHLITSLDHRIGLDFRLMVISAPLPQLWDFLARAENLHVWGPATEPVKGFDRPMRAGDRATFWRQDFFRRYTQ